MRLGQERAEIFVTGPIFHQHGQKSAILHRQVGTDDRTYALLSAGDRKSLRTVNTVAIEQGNGRQSELGRPRGELLGERSAAEKTEGAAGVQFDVGHARIDRSRSRIASASKGRFQSCSLLMIVLEGRTFSHKCPRLPSPLRVPRQRQTPPSSNCKSHSARSHFFASHQSPEVRVRSLPCDHRSGQRGRKSGAQTAQGRANHRRGFVRRGRQFPGKSLEMKGIGPM